ncbi:class A sortase [Apilactobacillus quenuiae]|uniref:class A sortase n=1 Tax=Apilactobacillus quenuiae TaxID=2008377 RepID=UPI000D02048D|nr:class A sortase [Apilactobacillus quenuiae]
MKKKLGYTFIIITAVVGMLLLFNQSIANHMIITMTTNSLKQNIHKNKQKAVYNFDNVKNVDTTSVFKAVINKDNENTPIGKISIPSVNIKLPIYLGLANNNLLSGVGTMIKGQKMGLNNYTLAGHHMKDNNLLFGPLSKVNVNHSIYITNGIHIYRYKIKLKKIINEYQTKWINENSKKPVITLITCATGNPGETNRIMIRGNLDKIYDYKK